MTLTETQLNDLRSLIRRAMGVYMEQGDLPTAATVMPRAHFEALRPDVPLVIGARGTGKSVWHNVLTDPEKLAFIRKAYPEVELPDNLRVLSGYSANQEGSDEQPPKEVSEHLSELVGWRVFWQVLIAARLFPEAIFAKEDRWEVKGEKTKSDIEAFSSALRAKDAELSSMGTRVLIVFDALDTISSDWNVTTAAIKELLKLFTDYRLLKNIRFKVFLRSDMAADASISAFPDASKLFSSAAELTWLKQDLFTLFFQRLANDPSGGALFRFFVEDLRPRAFSEVDKGGSSSWILERQLRVDDDFHRALFACIAGKAMGGGASGFKRGIPYSWIYNHLLDAKGSVSPRSFCAALYEAADPARLIAPNYPLTPKDLESGVRGASRIRVKELAEDYPWISIAMDALKQERMRIPCEREAMIHAWEKARTIKSILADPGKKIGLPSTVKANEYQALLDALQAIGIASPMSDNLRYQVPDVYRVAFGLGRKGGIPIKTDKR
jgi:hypothetical protein